MTDALLSHDDERAQRHLEWERLSQAVLDRCHSEATRRRGVPLEGSLQASSNALGETGEVMRILDLGEAIPLHEMRDLDTHLTRLSRAGDLDGPALAEVRYSLRCARAVRKFVRARSDQAKHLQAVCHLDPTLDQLEDLLSESIELDGTLFDHASADLRKLRAEVSNLRARVVARLEELIDRHRDLLSDSYYTLRDDRYVLPVRTDAHERFNGIVHGTSDSGASIFVEPSAIVPQGNRLKMAQAELHREEMRILSELSARVAEYLPEIRAAQEALCRFDLRQASAHLAHAMKARVPELASDGKLHLENARHPLLLLDGVEVVPNDLSLSPGQALVVSGPNAGGKTVLLKTVGLFALMVRSGLPIPAGEGSVMGFFERVLTDLGDEQSTQHNLSTFSAHVRSLAHVLERAQASTLVLLDELCGGTDPQEGAALACAVAEQLVRQGSTLLVTTHYEQLKAFALREPHFRSASVGFDLATMEPSFALQMDVPGASSALSVAGRFGIPVGVVERARSIVPQQAKDFESLVGTLQEISQKLRTAEESAREEQFRITQLRRDHEERLSRLKERSQRKLTEEAEQLMGELREARKALKQARADLRDKALDARALKDAEGRVLAVGKRVAMGGDLAQANAPAPPRDAPTKKAQLHVGERVYVTHLRTEGTVLEVDDRGRARVAAGALKLWVDGQGLRAAGEKPGGGKPSKGHAPSAPAPRGPTSDNTVSVRGLRVDDALPMVETFVDRLLMSNTHQGYVDHGHGSGALRKAVREHLKHVVHHVSQVRGGNDDEGGDAMTVFTLAR